jgi:hypothetical protein
MRHVSVLLVSSLLLSTVPSSSSGRLSIPRGGEGLVLSDSIACVVEHAQEKLSIRITLLRERTQLVQGSLEVALLHRLDRLVRG